MAPLDETLIGVGPALRKARERRGLTLEEASRDTKLRVEQLRALEGEDFSALPGDIYVRGALRTYARYLGLRSHKVVEAYAQHSDQPEPPPPPAKLGRVERAIAATRIRDDQRLIAFCAALAIVLAVVFGFLSRGRSAPAPASLPTVAATPLTAGEVEAIVEAAVDVNLRVVRDGAAHTYSMREGETRTFMADSTLTIELSDGGAARITVNGRQLGIPGTAGQRWGATFTSAGGETLTSPGA